MKRHSLFSWVRIVKCFMFFYLIYYPFYVNSFSSITILNVSSSLYNEHGWSEDDFNLCKKWELSKKQVKEIFLLSEKLESYDSSTTFYWLWFPCSISGELISDEQKWFFTINGGGISKWTRGEVVIYFGCSVEKCDKFFILPYAGRDKVDF